MHFSINSLSGPVTTIKERNVYQGGLGGSISIHFLRSFGTLPVTWGEARGEARGAGGGRKVGEKARGKAGRGGGGRRILNRHRESHESTRFQENYLRNLKHQKTNFSLLPPLFPWGGMEGGEEDWIMFRVENNPRIRYIAWEEFKTKRGRFNNLPLSLFCFFFDFLLGMRPFPFFANHCAQETRQNWSEKKERKSRSDGRWDFRVTCARFVSR